MVAKSEIVNAVGNTAACTTFAACAWAWLGDHSSSVIAAMSILTFTFSVVSWWLGYRLRRQDVLDSKKKEGE